MNAAWANSLDHFLRGASWPIWLALAVAALFGLVLLVTLLRAEKSVANAVLSLIALLAIGVAASVLLREADHVDKPAAAAPAPQVTAALPVLSCLDELAGEMVLAACEKSLYASPDTVAAAVTASAALVDRLTSYGDVGSANRLAPPDLASLRNAVERDRYGLIAYVLQSRDRCTPEACFAYPSVPDHRRIASNMEERVYETMVTKYAPAWNAPPAAAAAPSPVPGVASLSGLPPSLPTGKPTNAEFPSSSSIPPISIMTDTPVRAPAADAKAAPRAAPKKQAAPKEAPAAPRPQAAAPAAPIQLAPGAPQADN